VELRSVAMDAGINRMTEQEASRLRLLWYVLGLLILVRLASLGAYPLFDKTEARYAYIGALMLRTGNWVTPLIDLDVPFWAKPPLSTWGAALSYAVLGVNTFAARLPSFVFVAGAGVLVYLLGASRDRALGLLAACIFFSSGLTFYLAGGVMTDPALLLGVTLTVAAFWECMQRPSRGWGYLFFIGLGISLLAKGPIGVVLPGLCVGAWVLWHNEWRRTWSRLPWITGTLLTLLIAVPWYHLAERSTPGFLQYFLIGEHFGRFLIKDWQGDLYGGPRNHPHGTIWLFSFLSTLPWSVLLLAAPFWRPLREALFSRRLINDPWRSYLLFWSLAAPLFFTFPRAVLITYVAMGLPGFALLTAQLLRDSGLERRSFVPAAAALVPVALVIGLLAIRLEPIAARLPAQVDVLALYDTRRSGPGYELYYIWEKPYSAEFYSRGRVKLAKTPADAARVLQQGGEPYFAVAAKQYAELPPDLRASLELVAERNATLLLRAKSTALSNAPAAPATGASR
jgi:4-amino-4-deoxy-L-arabinose transferase-like glycosyltransferase